MYSPNDDAPDFPQTPYGDTSVAPLEAERLAGSSHEPFDIAVIGGGITGTSLALRASEMGARVIVLEAKEVGWGASGRNGGHVPSATKLEPSELIRRYGQERGMRLADAVAAGPEVVYGITEKYGIDADVVRSGLISAACTPRSVETLKRRSDFWAAKGAPVRFLDRAASADMIGTIRYLGSSLDPRGGTINTVSYVRGMAKAAVGLGTRLFEHSAVTSYSRQNGKWQLDTAQGSVRADCVAICTNGYNDTLSPELRRSAVPVRAYQFLTEPLPDDVLKTILPGRQGLTDSRRLMSGIRVHRSGGLIFSGLGALFGRKVEPNFGYSLRRIQSLFPQLPKIKLRLWWTGWMAMNREDAWKTHELAPGMVAALGCNGRGLVIGTLIGRDFAEYFRGKPAHELLLPFSPMAPVPFFEIHPPLINMLVNYYRIRDAIDDLIY